MVNFVWIIGAVIAVWGIVVVILPNFMKTFVEFLFKNHLTYAAAGLKILIGIVFLIFARDCRLPWMIVTIGVLMAGGSILFCFLPHPKVRAFHEWWLERPFWIYRIWGVLAAIFGGIILYAGTPAV